MNVIPQQNENSRERFDLSDFNVAGTSIVSIVENRAREVCIAKMNSKHTSVLEVLLIVDSHSYTEVLSLIEDIQPHEILLHDGLKNSVLSLKILEIFRHDISIFFISRQYFDQDKGADMLQSVLVGVVDNDLIAKYTVLAGSFCLLKYIENSSGYTFPPHSVRMDNQSGSKNRMFIDRKSAVNLELVRNVRSGSKQESLFGVMNHTKTTVGAALLRKNLLNPCTDVATINLRLSVVESFLRCNRIYADIATLLGQFPEFERMLSGLVTKPKTITVKTARIGIDTLIYLKSTLRIAPLLARSLLNLIDVSKDIMYEDEYRIPSYQGEVDGISLVSSIVDNLNDADLQSVAQMIDDLLTESTTYTKNAYEMRHQECFAVKPSVNGYLDVARKTFLQSIEDIHEAVDAHAITLGHPIKISHSSSRGYFLSIPVEALGDNDYLPAEYIQPVLHRKTISCTTEHVSSLSDRAHESISTALTLTNDIIQDTMSDVRRHMASIFLLVDSIALLDMLCSFADLVALGSEQFVRPVLSEEGDLNIKGGRHLALSRLQAFSSRGEGSYVANDCIVTEDAKLVVVTGPNGSGKSTYIKTPVLIIVLAQIGCFVPAAHATIPIRDRILTRIGTNDDMEHNISTFSMEMKETAYILNNATKKSFIIIDELGRGTSNLDGIAIAFSIAEEIIRRDVMTLFVTHYTQLTTLPQLYPAARNIHLKSIIGTLSDGIQFLHQIGQGPCDIRSGYGIMMAKLSNFPDEVIADAREIQKTLRATYPVLMLDRVIDSNRLAVVNILKNVDLMSRESSLSNEEKQRYLDDLIESYTPMKAGIVAYINSCLEELRLEEFRSIATATVSTATVAPDHEEKRYGEVSTDTLLDSDNPEKEDRLYATHFPSSQSDEKLQIKTPSEEDEALIIDVVEETVAIEKDEINEKDDKDRRKSPNVPLQESVATVELDIANVSSVDIVSTSADDTPSSFVEVDDLLKIANSQFDDRVDDDLRCEDFGNYGNEESAATQEPDEEKESMTLSDGTLSAPKLLQSQAYQLASEIKLSEVSASNGYIESDDEISNYKKTRRSVD